MSTKIYNAYKFNGTYPELIKICKILKKKVVKDSIKWIKNCYPPADISKYNLALTILKNNKELLQEIDTSIIIYPHKKNIYIQFFGNVLYINNCVKYLEKNYNNIIEDFSYENSSDELPEGTTQRQYKRRKEIWNEIFDPEWYPHINGFSYEFVSIRDTTELLREMFSIK